MRGRVYRPPQKDEEGVKRPQVFGVVEEEFQDDGDGVDEAATCAEEHAPVVEALFSVEDAVDAEVDVEEEVECYGDDACGC